MPVRPGNVRRAMFIGVAVASAMACGDKKAPAPEIPIAEFSMARGRAAAPGNTAGLGGEARVALDSGNALFRAKKYSDALAQYRRSAQLAPQDPAPQFGIYMVAGATGNKALEATARAALRERGMVPPEGPHIRPDSVVRR
jgi:hypothetical protein